MARFGMPGGKGLGFLRSGAERYVDAGSKRAVKLANKVEAAMPAAATQSRYNPEFAAAHRNATIKARQKMVGKRYAIGGGLAAGSTMMLPNANQTRGGYKGPTARGSGRYA